MQSPANTLSEMNERSRAVFRTLVESYLSSGEPVGSRNLARDLEESVSAATVRNVMQDLEHLGLLNAPHVSAGRIPTQMGLRLFVDGLLQLGDVSNEERTKIEASIGQEQSDITAVLDRAGAMLSGLTQGASLVLAPNEDTSIKHVEFVNLSPERGLVVLVKADGTVENRLFTPPQGLTPSAMREAANFLNAILEGHTISEMRRVVAAEVEARRTEIGTLTKAVIESGLADWVEDDVQGGRLIVRGRSNLLDQSDAQEDLELIRQLFDDLERKEDLVQLLDLAEQGDGVRVFIGSENKLFSLSGSSLVVSPYMNAERRVIGAIGVIGPTRLNYGRVVPIVDYTAQLVGRVVSTAAQPRNEDEYG